MARASTNCAEIVAGQSVAPQVKQRVFCASETLANRLIQNGLLKRPAALSLVWPVPGWRLTSRLRAG